MPAPPAFVASFVASRLRGSPLLKQTPDSSDNRHPERAKRRGISGSNGASPLPEIPQVGKPPIGMTGLFIRSRVCVPALNRSGEERFACETAKRLLGVRGGTGHPAAPSGLTQITGVRGCARLGRGRGEEGGAEMFGRVDTGLTEWGQSVREMQSAAGKRSRPTGF